MIQVIQGDTDTFTAHAYGIVDPMTVEWCQQRANNVYQNLMPEAQKSFDALKGSVFDSVNYSSIARMAKAASRAVGALWQDNVIKPLTDIGSLQHPPHVMIDWIMAMPELQVAYNEQTVAGYDKAYIRQFFGDDPKENPHYQLAVSGLFLDISDEMDESVAVEYLSLEMDTEVSLDLYEQSAIQETWATVAHFLNKGKEDPTSKYNAML